MSIKQNNLDYKLSLITNNQIIDLTSDNEYKFDCDIFIDKNAQFASDSFTIDINNLPKTLIDKINKPRIKASTISEITYVNLSLKGNAGTEYYQVLQKEALEIKSLKTDYGTTYITTISGYSGANVLSFSSNINLSNITIPDLLKKIANNMGMNFVNHTVKNITDPINVKRQDFFIGEKKNSEILSKIEQSLIPKGYKFYLDNKDIVLINDNQYYREYEITEDNIKKSSDIQSNVITIECFLLPKLQIFDKIKIIDNTNKTTKGTYKITSIKHNFQYRNNGKTSGTTTVELLMMF